MLAAAYEFLHGRKVPTYCAPLPFSDSSYEHAVIVFRKLRNEVFSIPFYVRTGVPLSVFHSLTPTIPSPIRDNAIMDRVLLHSGPMCRSGLPGREGRKTGGCAAAAGRRSMSHVGHVGRLSPVCHNRERMERRRQETSNTCLGDKK